MNVPPVTEFLHGETPEEAQIKAFDYIAGLKDPDTIARDNFMQTLGQLIDTGRAIGMEVEFMNPLEASMKALSENIITDQRGKP